jgi:hypothetical protein
MKKINIFSRIFICITITLMFSCSENISVDDLLIEMTDRIELAKWPKHNYKLLQASSYDRKSVSSDKKGWFANGDNSQYVRVDTTGNGIEYVLMEDEGPGAIVRFWSAWHAKHFSNGTLRFYLDGNLAIEGAIDEVISNNKLFGKAFSFTSAKFFEHGNWYCGHNLYFPITYGKSCRITYQKATYNANDILYYNINYRKYDKGISVETFNGNKLDKGLVDLVGRILLNPWDIKGTSLVEKNVIIKPRDSYNLVLTGEKCIKKFRVKFESKLIEQELRKILVEIKFDGKPTVWAPIGELFATSYKINTNKTWMHHTTNEAELNLSYPMPFQNEVEILFKNLSDKKITIAEVELVSDKFKWDDRSLYFHADWKKFYDVNTNNKIDLNYIEIDGKGKFAGDVLSLYNDSFMWWGEGDEKIYVDGEKFPSHFGTGTEDYYGYAWCSVVKFETPFISQPSGDGNRSPGLTVNTRWRNLDCIPFRKSYKMDMELWHWGRTKMDYSPTVFWYGSKQAKSNNTRNIEWINQPIKFDNVYEGEALELESISKGKVIPEAFLSYSWSGRNHLLWKNFQKNDELVVSFHSERFRVGKLKTIFTIAKNYPVIDLYFNGVKVQENIDLYSSETKLKTFVTKKDYVMKKGKNYFKIVVKSLNKKANSNLAVGFDCFEILEKP